MKKLHIIFTLFFFLPAWVYTQPLSFSAGKTRALVIGISDYQDEKIEDLNFAHRDAEEFVAYLKSKSGGGLKDEQIMFLVNEDATYGKIFSALDWLIEESGKNDKVIIYFSGHGDVEAKIIRQQGFLLTHNTLSHNYRMGALGVDDVNAYLETLAQANGSKIILFADACRSGNLAGGQVGVQATAEALSTQFENTIKIMSCQANQFSLEGKHWGGGRGVFSYHLLDGLRGMADKNNDLNVNAFELQQYLQSNISEETDFSQVPEVRGLLSTKISFVDTEVLEQLKKEKGKSSDEPGLLANKGNPSSFLANADSSIREIYNEFLVAIDQKYFLSSDQNDSRKVGKSASELYEILSNEKSIKPLHGTMKRNFVAALQDQAQNSLNAYLKADPKELAERWNEYGKSYQSNPFWLNKAAEILGENHRIYNQIRAKQHYFEGVILRLEGEQNGSDSLFQKALEKGKLALSFDSSAAYIYNEIGLIYGNLKESEKEVQNYEQAVALAPTWVLPYNNLCNVFNKTGNSEGAIMNGLKAIKLNAHFASAFHNLALAYQGNKEYEKAEQFFLKSLDVDSNFVKAQSDLGMFYHYYTDEINKAEQAYLTAVRMDSTYMLPYLNLGWLYFNLKQYDESESMYQKAAEIEPQNEQVLMNFGILYHVKKEYRKAESLYLKIVKLNPNNEWSYYNMACISSLEGKTKEAVQWLEKAFKNGFEDVKLLESESDLSFIRNSSQYKALVKKYDSGN